MNLSLHYPQAPLADYVYMFWQANDYTSLTPQERILPHGTMELLFSLTDSTLSLCYPHQNQPQLFYGGVVAGARSDYFVMNVPRPDTYLSVYFKPGAAFQFFGVSALDLHNLHIPLADLWGSKADALYECLLMARTATQRFELLEGALLDELPRAKLQHPAVDFALQTLSPQTHRIGQLVNNIGISSTRFIKVFKDEIGFTPKLFCRVLRFQDALYQITRTPNPDWVDIALRCGYYDQAHLINEFQAMGGITPNGYAPFDPEHRNNLPMG